MSRLLSIVFIGACISGAVFLSSCGGNKSGDAKSKAGDNVAAGAYVNPRKGKIWEKENIVKIPLTAAENNLVGKVKSVGYKDYEIDIENGKEVKTLADSGYNEYDQAGHLIGQAECYGDKMPKWVCQYRYDEKNKPAEWHLRIYEENMDSKTAFKYDGAGNKIEEATTDNNKEYQRRSTFKYDGKGNQTEVTMYDKDGELKQIISYEYDKNGFQVAYIDKDADGEVFSKMTCEYDERGNKTGGADYSSEKDLVGTWKQINDQMGRRVENDYYKADGNLIEKRTIKYDDHGFAIEYNTNKADGSLDEAKSYSFKNEYDKLGNIIKQTEIRWKDGKRIPVNYSEYVITYY